MIDDRHLDLLVDGELGDPERRQLLLRLDAEPDGWRRCALAFLEAQTWREGMRALCSEPTAQAAASAAKLQATWRRLPTMLAVAACFLLAFGLGVAIDDLAAERAPGSAPSPDTHPLVGATPRQKPADAGPAVPPAIPLEPAPKTAVPYQYVSVPAEDPVSGQTESIRMPVIPRQYLDERWPYQLPSVVPDRVVKTLQQHGHDVVQHRRLVPLQTADGNHVVFPVDEVELVPVGNRGYQ